MLELIAGLFMLFVYAVFFGVIALIILVIVRVLNVSGRPVEENVIQR